MRIVDTLLSDYQSRHSDFQIDNFIIGKQGDNWSMYKQCLREIHMRSTSLVTLKEDLELMDIERWKWKFSISKKSKIRKKRRARVRNELVKSINETERELKRFVSLAKKLKRKIGELSYEKRAVLEADSWLQKARRMAGMDMLINRGQISQTTLEMIVALPPRERKSILYEIANGPDPNRLIGMDIKR